MSNPEFERFSYNSPDPNFNMLDEPINFRQYNLEIEVKSADIIIGEKTYKFHSNFSLPWQNDREILADELQPEYAKIDASNRIIASTNTALLYNEFMRRGFGIIPEMPPTDNNGREWDEGFSFYSDASLKLDTVSRLRSAIIDFFPEEKHPFSNVFDESPDELSQKEISKLMDQVLSRDEFADAEQHYQEHIASLKDRSKR